MAGLHDDTGSVLRERLVPRYLVMEDLPQIALVHKLAARRAGIEVVQNTVRLPADPLPDNLPRFDHGF
jgi:hypothetical protein